MSQTNIKCENCESSVVPRLYHPDRSIFSYSLTQHLCPICGVVMYESGGGIRTECKVIALGILVLYCLDALLEGDYSQFFWRLIVFFVVSIIAFPLASGKVVKKLKQNIIK